VLGTAPVGCGPDSQATAEVAMEKASVERSGRDPATVAREIVDANPCT
jgi:hypothetical protein